jgi:hypothetical protein
MAWKEICAMVLLSMIILSVMPTASASSSSLSNLKSLVSSFDDPRMSTEDLAFYLTSHGVDASPKGSFVEVNLDGHNYKLTPNGSAPGLCNIAA